MRARGGALHGRHDCVCSGCVRVRVCACVRVRACQTVLYAVSAGVAGYYSSRLYRQMAGTRWVWNVILTSALYAVPFFAVWFVLNGVAIYYRSTAALPFGTVMVVLAIWVLGAPLELTHCVHGTDCKHTAVSVSHCLLIVRVCGRSSLRPRTARCALVCAPRRVLHAIGRCRSVRMPVFLSVA